MAAKESSNMNKIKKDELFRHLSDFWKSRGIQLHDGSYTQAIKKGCDLLADTVNLSQQALERAKAQMEKQIDQVRQVIHERTRSKAPPRSDASSTPKSKSGRRKTKGARARRKGH